MSKKIEDYAFIGDRRSAALISLDGSIDWLCWPRFDSDACLAALLGDDRNGSWKLTPRDTPSETRRHYRPDTLVLETRHETPDGVVTVTDLMAIGTARRTIIRQITGEAGCVEMELSLKLRFDYGRLPPWQRVTGREAIAVIGPDLLVLHSDVELAEGPEGIVAHFRTRANDTTTFVLQYGLSYADEPKPIDAAACIDRTERYWRNWVGRFSLPGPWSDAIKRSLITLQALVHADTAGIIAAPTLGLPEIPHGNANWDYRYSWLRDSSLTLSAFLAAGFIDEAQAWRSWLLRTVAGDPTEIRTMYRVDGAIHIESRDIPWLPGYDGARPVKIGNAAATQRQLDIYGEVLNALHLAEQAGIGGTGPWDLRVDDGIIDHIEAIWRRPDQGIWESRDPARQFTHSKIMAWAAVDRFLRMSASSAVAEGRRQELERLRDTIHADICHRGFDPDQNSFVQVYGGHALDAALLRVPLIGFLPIGDPRTRGTIAAIERDLVEDGLVRRWRRSETEPDEGAFIACTCWLAECLAMDGREADARVYLERVLAIRNDVGLLAEEWDCPSQQLMGNFPQALSHLSLINAAIRLSGTTLKPR